MTCLIGPPERTTVSGGVGCGEGMFASTCAVAAGVNALRAIARTDPSSVAATYPGLCDPCAYGLKSGLARESSPLPFETYTLFLSTATPVGYQPAGTRATTFPPLISATAFCA